MNIIHVCLAQEYSDNYSYQENLLPIYHSRQGNNVCIIASLLSFNKSGQMSLLNAESTYKTKEGIVVHRINYRVPMKKLNKYFRRYNHIEDILKEFKPEIIFIHGCQFIDIFKFINYKKQNMDVKIYIDNHADYINSATNWLSKNILHRIIWRHCAKSIEPYAEKFWGVTPLRCDFLQKVYKISPKKIDLLIMGVDDDKLDYKNKFKIRNEIRERLNISNDSFVIISGGKIDKRKNMESLISAFINLNLKNVKLIIFGSLIPEMQSQFSESTKHENIIKIGWISSDKIYSYFLASDLAVFPGTHSVLWEQAAGSGLPCVFKHWSGMEHVDIGGNCKFLEGDSVDEIERVLLSTINNKDVYNEMKKSASSAMKYFSYNDIAKRSINEKLTLEKESNYRQILYLKRVKKKLMELDCVQQELKNRNGLVK